METKTKKNGKQSTTSTQGYEVCFRKKHLYFRGKPRGIKPTGGNKIAVVTGGSRGLGRDMALSLAKKGVAIVTTYYSIAVKKM